MRVAKNNPLSSLELLVISSSLSFWPHFFPPPLALEARVRRDPTLQDVLNENAQGNVYRGIGEEIKRLIVRYSVIIHLYYEEYEHANRNRKRQIKLEIYRQVHLGGGRFLHEDRTTEMTEEAALKKIGRALTDAADRARLAGQQPETNEPQERDDDRMEEDRAEPNSHEAELNERQQPNGANNMLNDVPQAALGNLDNNITQVPRNYDVLSDGISNMGTTVDTGNTSNNGDQERHTLQSLHGNNNGSAQNNLQNLGGFLQDETMHEFGSDDETTVNYNFHKFPEEFHVQEQSNLQIAQESESDDSVDPRFKDPDYPEFDADDDASELDATEIEAHPWYRMYDR